MDEIITEKGRGFLEVACAFIVPISPSVCMWVACSQPRSEVHGGLICFLIESLECVGCAHRIVVKNSVQQKCFSYRLLSSSHYGYIRRRPLEEETLPCL